MTDPFEYHTDSDYSECGSLFDYYQYQKKYISYYHEYEYVSSKEYCTCSAGYEGNPYMVDGCEYPDGLYNNNRSLDSIKTPSIIIGSVVGGLILLTTAWNFGKTITETVKASRKYMFYKRNGGILLEQQLAAIENGIERTRLFTSVELAKATDDYNENRVLGRGGEGVVYKGMLEDGRIVAVKKSERVNQGDVVDFINEVVIVSQITLNTRCISKGQKFVLCVGLVVYVRG